MQLFILYINYEQSATRRLKVSQTAAAVLILVVALFRLTALHKKAFELNKRRLQSIIRRRGFSEVFKPPHRAVHRAKKQGPRGRQVW
jgi:hypothetical protein